jgi:hypothetical protein
MTRRRGKAQFAARIPAANGWAPQEPAKLPLWLFRHDARRRLNNAKLQ